MIEGGQVVDDSTNAPVAHVVVSLHALANGGWQVVDSARTDMRGLFQFARAGAGIYRVGVLGTTDPQFVGPADTLSADSMNTRSLTIPMLRTLQGRVYSEFQVERPASIGDKWSSPEYPPSLRGRRIEGHVGVQFVVNPDGSVDLNSIKWLQSSDPGFTTAVRDHLRKARFVPGTIDGHPVHQVVRQEFGFKMN